MTNSKIYRLAKRMFSDFTKPPQTPNDVYTTLTGEKNYWDYFKHMGPDNFIKLCICTWGVSLNMPEEQIEEWYDKVFFATVFSTEDETYYDECGQCDGGGHVRCDNCNGIGDMECDECEGDLEVTCHFCDGDGKIDGDDGPEDCDECEGKGQRECDECNGTGKVTCHVCGGDGDVYCDDCNGDGNLETDEKLFDIQFIVCWNRNLYDVFEIKEEEFEEVMPTDRFYDSKSIIILGEVTQEHAELSDDISSDEIYCLGVYNQLPNVRFEPRKPKFFTTPSWDISHLQ